MKAIDLYSGIGGWTLGLKLSGIDVMASYEWWAKANDTHNQNFGTRNVCADVRKIDVNALPEDIDFVVGSPPCTQFSFSNKGGSGDLAEGIKDVWKFLEVVDRLRPKYWVFENVPRLANIIKKELETGNALSQFAHLIKVITVVDMSEYGLPQKRRRALIGSFPIELLESYRSKCEKRTLEDVLSAFNEETVYDFLYGYSLHKSQVTEINAESCLDEEESRMNREAKTYHPVYNLMSFPDKLDRPSRTVTATCTRVSRESIIIEDNEQKGCIRRLTPRERAMCQGFPISFQFYGGSYSNKLKMIGNAIPPYFTYYLANALQEVSCEELIHPANIAGPPMNIPTQLPPETKLDSNGRRFPAKRKFRAALPRLRFGSGVRFELTNTFSTDVGWVIDFYHGPSKAYKQVELNHDLLSSIRNTPIYNRINDLFVNEADILSDRLSKSTSEQIQSVWTRLADGLSPYQLVDLLGDIASKLMDKLKNEDLSLMQDFVLAAIYEDRNHTGNGAKKISANAIPIFAGMLIGAWFNTQSFQRS